MFRETGVTLPDGAPVEAEESALGITIGATELVGAAGDMVGRVAFDEQARIIGLLIVPTDHDELPF